MTQWEAALLILHRAGSAALHYQEITDRIVSAEYCTFETGTPAQSVRVAMTVRCPHSGLFKGLGEGRYEIGDLEKAAILLKGIEAPLGVDSAQPSPYLLPEEIKGASKLVEGADYAVTVNAYERNPIARSHCIAYYGPRCIVCGFDFAVVYGPLAEGFVHVHHMKRLSEIGEEYQVDPVADLRPVCPNCHAIIHLGGGCRSIEEARRLINPRVLAFWASLAEPVAPADRSGD